MATLRDDGLVRYAQRYIVIGLAIMVVLAALGLALTTPMWIAVAIVGAVLGGLFVHAGLEIRRSAAAVAIYRELAAAISEGRLDDADATIDAALMTDEGREPLVARVLLVCRSTVANARGDFAKSAEAATAAIAQPSPSKRDWDDVLQLEARALRAVASAVLGSSVDEDLAVIAISKHGGPPILARAEVARAIALARAEKKKELTEHLLRHATLMLSYMSTHERALFRALQSWARATGSAYREAPRSGEGRLRAWVEKAVPAAAAFAPSEPAGAASASAKAPELSAEQSREVLMSRLQHVKPRREARWWTYLIGVVGIFTALSVERLDGIGAGLLSILLITLVSYLRVHLANGQSSILAAERDVALNRIDRARHALRRVAKNGTSIGASAGHHLAILANREGDFAGALREVEAALTLCKPDVSLEVTRFFVLPGLLAENAIALAGLERYDEAECELTTLASAFPDYAHLTATSFRVRLVIAMRRGDKEAAAAVAATRAPDLALDFGTEMLVELALGGNTFASDVPPMIASWLKKVAPSFTS